MKKDERRITLIARNRKNSERNWNDSGSARLVMVDSVALLRSTIASPLVHSDADVERIILDRCSSDGEFLTLLSELPHQFTGDVLLIRSDGSSFLSATGRGGDRVLYALTADDVEFYLEAVRVVPQTEMMKDHVLQFRPREIPQGAERTAMSRKANSRHRANVLESDETGSSRSRN